MAAGYISAETYSVLKPKARLCNLDINEYSSYPDNIATEIRKLFEDDVTHMSICGIEQMEVCLLNDDKRPYELLETLLLYSDDKVKDFLSNVGSKFFLLDYVFSNKDSLNTRIFVNDDNISVITDFIVKYENAFVQLFTTEKNELDLIAKEPIFYKPYVLQKATENSVVGEYSESYTIKNVSSPMTQYPIAQDAVSLENIALKKYVVILSQLTDEEFEPFRMYLDNQLVGVSVRTTNCIKSVGYHEFYVNYLFAKEDKLLSIRKFGRKSLFDFKQIRQHLIKHVIECIDHSGVNLNTEENLVTTISEDLQHKQLQLHLTLKEIIGDTQYAILDKILHGGIQELSVRARNAINYYPWDFIEDFVHKNKNIMDLKSIGKKSFEEIQAVVMKLKEYAEEAKAKSQEEISPEKLQIIEYEMYFDYCWDDFSCRYFLRNGHLPMLHILENWINNCTDKGWNIFKSCLPLFAGIEPKTLDELAEKYNLTRERCRQLCVKHIEKFQKVDDKELSSSSINLTKIITKTEEWQYLTKATSSNNLLEIGIMHPYVVDEKCNLSQEFCFFILSILLASEYSLVGNEVISLPTRAKRIWNNTYLIRREYVDAFNFREIPILLEETENSLTENVEVDAEQLVIDTFFLAWNNFDTDKVCVVSDILSHILIQEYGKIPNEKFQFTLESKKVINATDIIYNILYKNGDLMTVDNIFTELDKTFPNRYKSSDSVRALVANDPRICMIGKASLVGLLEWKHIKIGSIRDIIVHFLSKFDEPQPVAKIVEYVQQYRDSTEKSIRSSMGSGNQFVQFSGGLYGLKDKTYAEWYDIPEKRRSFALRVNEMEDFLRKNLHFPFSQSDNSIEESLYTWWRRIAKSEELSDEQRTEIKRIQELYKDYPATRRDNEWYEFYRKYKGFIQDYCRKPQRNIPREKPLYSWFEKCMNDFVEGKLSSSKEKMYIELCKLL